MSAFTEQLPTLIGVILGALLSYGAGAFTERSNWRRTQAVRWDERRIQAYADYGAAAKVPVILCLRMARALKLTTLAATPLDLPEGKASLGAADDRRSQLFENLLLLGDAAVIDAARKWHETVTELEGTLDPDFDGEPEGFDQLYRRVGLARDRFYELARTQLQVSGLVSHD